MFCSGPRRIVRTGVTAALLLGVGTALAVGVFGRDRVGAVFHEARGALTDAIDSNITDPVALRAQLRSLQEQYPHRIGEVRGDLAELRAQMTQLQRELAVSNRVVELADDDIGTLQAGLDQAQQVLSEQVALASLDNTNVEHDVVIVFKGERVPVAQANTKLDHVTATRNAYASRAADIQRDLGYLSQQEGQLTNLLTKLETEQTAFQTQLFDLDRQIDAIGRNERMISIMGDRQKTLDEQSRYRAGSLDQVTARLADIRAKQEAQLQSLAAVQDHFSYEDEAKRELDRQSSAQPRQAVTPSAKVTKKVIEVDPAKSPAKDANSTGSISSANR